MKFLVLCILSISLLSFKALALSNENLSGDTMQSQPPSTFLTNKSAGELFLSTNKNKKGVVTLADGLQYKIIQEGHGIQPTENDTVTVHYEGRLLNGTVFDSSYKRGEPMTFPVSGVIPGWVEALKLMKTGSIWELYIPADLAYGDRGAPPLIGPNETLIFKVNLINVKK